MHLISTMILLALVLGLALAAFGRGITRRLFGPKSYKLANITAYDPNGGTHKGGRITKVADAAITVQYSLVTFGSTTKSIKANASNTIPIGIVQDTTDTLNGDLTIPVHVELFGSAEKTMKVAINSTVTQGDFLIADSTTPIYAMTDPLTSTSRVVQIGRALQSGVAGQVIEFDPNFNQVTH